MTLGDHLDGSLTPDVAELLIVVASVEDARALAPLGRPGSAVTDEPVRPVLVATGPDPLGVDAELDELDAPAGRLLLLDGPSRGWAEEAARLVVRLDALIAGEPPAGVVVRGGSEAALAAARSAVEVGVPVLHLPVPASDARSAATGAVVAELAAWQTSPEGGVPYPTEIDLLVHRRLTPAPSRPRHAGDPNVVRMSTARSSRSSLSA
jgi:hypothetical protein